MEEISLLGTGSLSEVPKKIADYFAEINLHYSISPISSPANLIPFDRLEAVGFPISGYHDVVRSTYPASNLFITLTMQPLATAGKVHAVGNYIYIVLHCCPVKN
jgi:hypothetical protein